MAEKKKVRFHLSNVPSGDVAKIPQGKYVVITKAAAIGFSSAFAEVIDLDRTLSGCPDWFKKKK
jgi:hypothetical protein